MWRLPSTGGGVFGGTSAVLRGRFLLQAAPGKLLTST